MNARIRKKPLRYHVFCCLMALLLLGACSGDSVRVTASNNSSSSNESENGFSIGVSTDATENNENKAQDSFTVFSYDTSVAEEHIFCLVRPEAQPAMITVLDSGEYALLAIGSGCAGVMLEAGKHSVEVLHGEGVVTLERVLLDDALVSVVQVKP